jgi:beta-alanine--pyruvate transaminase
VTPDIMNVAKQITNGAQPLGAWWPARRSTTPSWRGGPDYMLEFAHGYTYSAHPVACAAGMAALDVLVKEDMINRVKGLAPYFEQAVHSLKGAQTCHRHPQLRPGGRLHHCAPCPASRPRRPYEIAMKCWKKGFYVRYGGDTIQLAPPFIIEKAEIDSLINALGETAGRRQA